MLTESIGWVGSFFFLLAYFLVSRGKICGKSKSYNFMNLIGAVLYGIYAVIKDAWPVFVLEFFWGGLAIFALWKVFTIKKEKS